MQKIQKRNLQQLTSNSNPKDKYFPKSSAVEITQVSPKQAKLNLFYGPGGI
jgi:hypothetical protein